MIVDGCSVRSGVGTTALQCAVGVRIAFRNDCIADRTTAGSRGDCPRLNHQPIQMLPGTSAIGAPNSLNYQRPSVCPSSVFSVPSVVCLVDS